MRLMRFLAVGRSIGAVGTAPSRYRMNAQALLPKFGAQTTNTRAAAVPQAASAIPKVEPAQPRAMESKASAPDTSSPQRQPSRARFWKWMRPRFGSKRQGASTAAPPIQGELALDMVRPVRNDLSDSDFEIVTHPKVKATPAALEPLPLDPAAVQPAKPGAKVLWGRVKGRLFGVAETHAR